MLLTVMKDWYNEFSDFESRQFVSDEGSCLLDRGNSSIEGRRALCGLACMIIVFGFLLTACVGQSPERFPTLPSDDSSSSESVRPTVGLTTPVIFAEPNHLRFSLPVSPETAERLVRIFSLYMSYAAAGNMAVDFSEEEIQAVEPLFTYDFVSCSAAGYSREEWIQLRDADRLPDVFPVSGLEWAVKESLLLPLDEYAAFDRQFSSARLFPGALDSCRIDSVLYGIPYRGAAEVLFFDMRILSEAGVSEVPFLLDVDGLTTISEAVLSAGKTEEEETQRFFPLYSTEELIPFVHSSFAGSQRTGYFSFYDGAFHFADQAFADGIAFLREYRGSGYTFEGLPQETKDLYGEDSPPAAMWIDSTASLTEVSSGAVFSQIPSGVQGAATVPFVHAFPLCVGAASDSPKLAFAFAAFLSLSDTAAELCAEDLYGDSFFPFLSAQELWEHVYDGSAYRNEWLSIYQVLPEAIYFQDSNRGSVMARIRQRITEYSANLLDEEMNLTQVIRVMSGVAVS